MGTPYVSKRAIIAELVVVMDLKRFDRGLYLIDVPSRVLRKGEIHEVIITDETPSQRTVNRVAYIGFAEFLNGGLLVPGDKVYIRGQLFGRFLGFDETHMPNHYNLVINTQTLLSGKELGFNIGDIITFHSEEAVC